MEVVEGLVVDGGGYDGGGVGVGGKDLRSEENHRRTEEKQEESNHNFMYFPKLIMMVSRTACYDYRFLGMTFFNYFHLLALGGIMKFEVFPRLSSMLSVSHLKLALEEVWLDRISGRICMSISSKAMLITNMEDRRHWTWFPTEESRFHLVAYCQQEWWFELSGAVKFPFPPDVYTLTFRVHLGKISKRLGRRACNFEHTHGWDLGPVRYELSTSDGQHAVSECYLDDIGQDDANGSIKRGSWIEYKVGEFIVNTSDPVTEVRFSMKQIDCTHSKGGLCVDSVSITPSNLKVHPRKGV